MPVGADRAHAAGITGAGVEVGVLDDGKIDDYAQVDGKVAWYQDDTDKGCPELIELLDEPITMRVGGLAYTCRICIADGLLWRNAARQS